MKIFKFAKEVYEPILHIIYSGMWFFSLLGTLILVEGQGSSWKLGIESVFAILTLFLVLFFLRVADELKDLEYDRLHNPDRPLVTGIVSKQDLYRYLGIVAGLTLLINIWSSILLTAIVAADMIWGIALIKIEKLSKTVKNNMLCNLLVTYPVNIALSVYIYTFFLQQYNAELTSKGMLIVIAFAFAFLNYEFARKISWPHLAKENERLYSNDLGGPAAAIITLTFSLIAILVVTMLISPWSLPGISRYLGWLMLLPLIPALFGFVRFFVQKTKRYKYTVYGILFISLYYLTLGIVSIGANVTHLK